MQDGLAVYDSFKKITSEYSASNVCNFLKACWLIPEDTSLQEDTLNRMIIANGDNNEVYSSFERLLISQNSECVFSCNFNKISGSSLINCKCSVLAIPITANTYEYCIAMLKIFRKAYDNFHIMLFVASDGIVFGCSRHFTNKNMDFALSPKITESIDWTVLFYLVSSRNDSSDFKIYYNGLLDMIHEIPKCFNVIEEDTCKNDFTTESFFQYCNNDNYDDADEYLDQLSTYHHICEDQDIDMDDVLRELIYQFENSELIMVDETKFDYNDFISEVELLNDSLSFIESNKVNTLEMLFDCEDQETDDVTKNIDNDFTITEEDYLMAADDYFMDAEDYLDDEEYDFIDDPIELIKRLKKNN